MARKHIITCDMCKKEIDKVLHSFHSTEYVEVKYPELSLFNTDFNEVYRKIKECATKGAEDFGITIEVAIGYKTKYYDLCSKCRKKLVSFIEEGQNG